MNHPTDPREHPVGDWLTRYELDEDSAVREVFDVFYQRLLRLARTRLSTLPRQVADDEGAVISALRSFFSGVQNGRFEDIHDEDSLWRLLATITARKAIRQMRVHWKQSGEAGNLNRAESVESLLSRQITPDEETMMVEEFENRLDSLDDSNLREIAIMKLEGFDNREIADRFSIHIRSVQRKLKLIEARWLEND